MSHISVGSIEVFGHTRTHEQYLYRLWEYQVVRSSTYHVHNGLRGGCLQEAHPPSITTLYRWCQHMTYAYTHVMLSSPLYINELCDETVLLFSSIRNFFEHNFQVSLFLMVAYTKPVTFANWFECLPFIKICILLYTVFLRRSINTNAGNTAFASDETNI